MNEKLFSFLYDLEKEPKVVSFLLENGTVISGMFATPKPPTMYVGRWKYQDAVLLKSVTIFKNGQPVAKHAEWLVEHEDITSWALGKVTAITPSLPQD